MSENQAARDSQGRGDLSVWRDMPQTQEMRDMLQEALKELAGAAGLSDMAYVESPGTLPELMESMFDLLGIDSRSEAEMQEHLYLRLNPDPSQPSPWNYDMGQAPRVEDKFIYVAEQLGSSKNALRYKVSWMKFGEQAGWVDRQSGRWVRNPYAWMPVPELPPMPEPPATPTLPKGKEQPRG